MKNKLLVLSIATLSLFTLTGCNNNQTKAITSLASQVSRVERVVSKTNEDISSVSPISSYSTQSNSVIQNHRANSYYNMARENQLRQEVLQLNSTVKSCLSKDIRLSKSKLNALRKLSTNISNNTSKYAQTKSQLKTSVKNIKQSLKVPKVNIAEAESEYISLNGNMSERYVYLCNIYDNLEQAYIIICDCCYNKEQTIDNNNNNYNKTEYDQDKTNQTTNKNSRFRKNIDSYAPQTNNIKENTQPDTNEQQTKDIRNIDSFNNYKPPVNNGYNMPYGYRYNNPPINNQYNFANGYNGYAYNNGYGYANGYRRFNPNGNTDTFYPYNRNIDTYRTYPNINYPVSATPIEERKDFEAKENGVINLKQNEETLMEIPEKKFPDSEIVPKTVENKEEKSSELKYRAEEIIDKGYDLIENIKQGD